MSPSSTNQFYIKITVDAPSYPLISVFTNKLSQVMELAQPGYPKTGTRQSLTLLMAIKHQNIIGWDLFLKGYISIYWSHPYEDLKQHDEPHNIPNREVKLTGAAIGRYKGIWDARNKDIHGGTTKESKIAQRKKKPGRGHLPVPVST
jgi:hypothetical protein